MTGVMRFSTKRLPVFVALTLALCLNANADIWKWVDANGVVHLVDSDRPIYTWIDEHGKVFFADKPGHEDAVSVELIWHSNISLDEVPQDGSNEGGDDDLHNGETPAEREQREAAEAYYCGSAKKVYDTYKNAPNLYKTNSAGEREYLSDEESAQTLVETKARVDELCG